MSREIPPERGLRAFAKEHLTCEVNMLLPVPVQKGYSPFNAFVQIRLAEYSSDSSRNILLSTVNER